MPKVIIEKATRRDTSYIAMNMRDIDKREIYCLSDQESPVYLTHVQLSISPRWAYNAFIERKDGSLEPVCAYGISEYRPGICELWAFGTSNMYGALRDITDHMIEVISKGIWEDKSIWRLECRSSFEHTQAHKWIERLGLYKVPSPLYNFGKNGEHFWLFETSRKQIGDREHQEYIGDIQCADHLQHQRPSQLRKPQLSTVKKLKQEPTQQEKDVLLQMVAGLQLQQVD